MKFIDLNKIKTVCRGKKTYAIDEALKNIFPEEIVNQAASYFPVEDLIENLASKYGMDANDVLFQVASISGLGAASKVPVPDAKTLGSWKLSSTELANLHLAPGFKDGKNSVVCANPSTIDTNRFIEEGYEVFLALGSRVRKAWDNYSSKELFEQKAREEDLKIALEKIILEVSGLNVRKIALGYPASDSFQYRANDKTLQGTIHPKLVFLANQLIFENNKLVYSFARVRAELKHETFKGETLLILNLETEEQTSNALNKVSEIGSRKRSVVIVDDQQGFLKVLGSFMERKGWKVTSFASPEEALAYLNNNGSTDLLVSDYHFRSQTGLNVIEKVREFSPDLPIVVLSGDSRPEIQEKLVKSGVSAFVRKQEDPRVLMAWCNTLIEKQSSNSPH